MEEKGDKFELKNNTEAYKITLKKFICIILIIVILVAIIIYSAFKMYYEREDSELLSKEHFDQVLENLENKTNQEKTEEDYENQVNYNYSDFLDNDFSEISNTSQEEESFNEEFDIEEYEWITESAIEYIYGLNSNPLYAIANQFSSYDLLKNSEKQADGSYNIKVKFDDLSESIYFIGLHPSCLKTNESLKNNIKILSEEQINIKDTGIVYDYSAVLLSFDKIGDNEYKGYICVEEYDEELEHDIYKYAQVTVKFNADALITNIEWNEVPEAEVPEDLVLEDYSEDYENYSYSDYISQ